MVGDGSAAFIESDCASMSIVDVGEWILATLGISNDPPSTIAKPARVELERLVLLVFDGLGAMQVEEFGDACPFIRSLSGANISTTFPSTTASALTTLCTGKSPSEHGIIGYSFRSTMGLLNIVRYTINGQDARRVLDPFELQPEPTIFEIASDARVNTWIVTDDEFRGSGFTNVFLRGGSWRGWRDPMEMSSLVKELLPLGMRSLIYAYYDGLDTAGHVDGVGSERYLEALSRCDQIAAEIGSDLSEGEGMVILSDHGMVNVSEKARRYIEPELDEMCSGVGGEARCRYLYARVGAEEELLRAATEAWSDFASVMSREEALAAGLFGKVPGNLVRARIGDVLVISTSIDGGVFRRNRNGAYPVGNHGSVTDQEVEIPFKIAKG